MPRVFIGGKFIGGGEHITCIFKADSVQGSPKEGIIYLNPGPYTCMAAWMLVL